MTRPHPGPFTAPNLRHHQSSYTFVAMLALAGTIACGSEGTTGPLSPDPAASAKQLKVPTVVSFMLQSEMDAYRAQIEKQRLSNNEVAWMSYIDEYTESQDQWLPPPEEPAPAPPPPYEEPLPPPSDCGGEVQCPEPYSLPGGGRKGSGAGRKGSGGTGEIRPMLYDDTWDCKALKDQMTYYSTKFRGNYKLFWFQALTGQHYQNFLPGGTVDAMTYYTRQMSFTFYAYKDQGCLGRPPRGGWTLENNLYI